MCEIMDRIREEGRTSGVTSSLKSLMKTMKCSAEEAMRLLEIPEKEREKYVKYI